jgi:hypothetical protein
VLDIYYSLFWCHVRAFEEAGDYEYWGKRVGVFMAAAVKVVVN